MAGRRAWSQHEVAGMADVADTSATGIRTTPSAQRPMHRGVGVGGCGGASVIAYGVEPAE
jgi:hypothetical protein